MEAATRSASYTVDLRAAFPDQYRVLFFPSFLLDTFETMSVPAGPTLYNHSFSTHSVSHAYRV